MDEVNQAAAQSGLDTPNAGRVPASKSAYLSPLVLLGIFFVLLADVWFVSYGTWTRWPGLPRADYYDQLANAFAHGGLSLEQKVDPAVLALAHPYSPYGRQGVPIPLDFTLYHGRYYLYFGPVPALPTALLKLLGAGRIGDQFLVFAYVFGIGLLQALLLIKIRHLFFAGMPGWLLAVSIVLSGLVSPFAWILTEARVYEAALAAGQFFFLTGSYFALTALTKKPGQATAFLLAGAAWALAIGSRLSQALPISVVCLLIGSGLLWSRFGFALWSKAIRPLFALGLPLAVGLALLGWYNWARFGSVFETGYQYQITGTNFQRHDEIFSPVYILPNAYDYLVARPEASVHFPFLQPVRGRGELRFPFLDLPWIYHTRAMTGFLVSVPFVVFAALSLPVLLPLKKRSGAPAERTADGLALRWIILGLWSAFLAGIAPMLSFFWAEERYVLDFTPSLILLSVLGFFVGCQALSRQVLLRRVYLAGALALMLTSVVVSSLLAYSMHSSGFQIYNPALWTWLTHVSAP